MLFLFSIIQIKIFFVLVFWTQHFVKRNKQTKKPLLLTPQSQQAAMLRRKFIGHYHRNARDVRTSLKCSDINVSSEFADAFQQFTIQ